MIDTKQLTATEIIEGNAEHGRRLNDEMWAAHDALLAAAIQPVIDEMKANLDAMADIAPKDPEVKAFLDAGREVFYGGGWPSGAPCKRCKKVMVAWGMRFCEECKKFITSCPATHAKASESCNLCRDMPGYVEVIQ